MKKQFLECGKIVSTHGIRGEVKAQPWCDTPDTLLDFETLYFDRGETPITVERARVHKNMVILQIAGVDTPEGAVALRGKTLYMKRDDMALAPGECFVQDLIGCETLDVDTGVSYGIVQDVLQTGANDVYALRDAQGKDRLVPAIPDVVIEKDVDAGIIRIRPLAGLFDD